MMKADRILMVVIPLLLFTMSSCFQRPITVSKAKNNETYTIYYLFEHDGCKVYRFNDQGNDVYFTSCNGEVSYKKDSITVIKNTTINKKKKQSN